MTGQAAVQSRGLTKIYSTAQGRRGVRAALGRFDGLGPDVNRALNELDLEVPHGQALGLIGPNGAGKSTFLKLVAGITRPSAGSIAIDGKVRSVIELSAGFHPELTGTENVRCLGVVYGQTLGEIDAALPRITEFAGIADAMDEPVKHYSVGMKARLAFALVTDQRPDILAVDEVLSVGDQEFQIKCLERIQAMIRRGTTLLFVSHEMSLVSAVCDRVIHLRDGWLVDEGDPAPVIERYLTRSASRIARAPDSPITIRRAGVTPGGTDPDDLQVWVEIEATGPVLEPAIGVEIILPLHDPGNVIGSSTIAIGPVPAAGRYRISGMGTTKGFAAANLRYRLSIVDRRRHRALDVTSVDVDSLGDVGAVELRPYSAGLTMPVDWEMAKVDDVRPGAVPGPSRPHDRDAAVVIARDVTKRYRARGHGASFRAALPGAAGEIREAETVALDGASLTIGPGESVGLIGPNGSGKTTMLRVLAGVTRHDRGEVQVTPGMVSVLELGAGFHNDFTGAENIRVLARLMGIPARDLRRITEAAEEFSGLGHAIGDQLRTYSTGMMARLALGMALSVPAELILIDEALSVGDQEFRRQVMDRLVARQADGLAILFVSHDLQIVEQLCERVVRLDAGRVIADGPTDEVIGDYAGSSWAGGVHDADGGVRLQRLTVDNHRIPMGGTLVAEGSFVVDEPCPNARIEFSLRTQPEDRSEELTLEARAVRSATMVDVVPHRAELLVPGTYRFRTQMVADHVVGEADVVVSAIDDDRHIVLSEVWEHVIIGSPEPGARLSMHALFDWDVERLDEGV